jgi:N-acetylmuramoyl-L-alanine amidase CwlA
MMSDATGSDVEDLPEDKTSYAAEGSGKESSTEPEDVKKIQDIPGTLNPNDFLSKPFLSKKCTVPEDILVFQYPSLLLVRHNNTS